MVLTEKEQNIIELIAKIMEQETGCSLEDIQGDRRHERVVICRHVFYYFMRVKLHWIYTDIAKFFNKHHSTVMYGIENVYDAIKMYKNVNLREYRYKPLVDIINMEFSSMITKQYVRNNIKVRDEGTDFDLHFTHIADDIIYNFKHYSRIDRYIFDEEINTLTSNVESVLHTIPKCIDKTEKYNVFADMIYNRLKRI